MRSRAATIAVLLALAAPTAAAAHRPSSAVAARTALSWVTTRHVDCSWVRCRAARVVYNAPAGQHSRLVGTYLEYQGSPGWPWNGLYDCVRVDHALSVSFRGDVSCWAV